MKNFPSEIYKTFQISLVNSVSKSNDESTKHMHSLEIHLKINIYKKF